MKTPPASKSPIRWVGGKAKLLVQLTPLLPDGVEKMRYFEPFLGGGAMFFERSPEQAFLSDINPALIAMYKALRDDFDAVIKYLKRYASKHNEEHYYRTRDRYNEFTIPAGPPHAAMFIYLNKTCFNGVYRVNKSGAFNVPMDTTRTTLEVDVAGLRAASAALINARLLVQPFEAVTNEADKGDFVYFDPPYEPVSKTANFTSYTKGGFSREDQETLRYVFGILDSRCCNLMLSNSDTPFIRELYKDFNIDTISAARSINSNGAKRGAVREIVVRNY